jgi:hypothetical protein
VTTERLDSRAIQQGTKIGRFVVVNELGSGGMGAVYAAHDPQLDRQVALKVMRGATGEEEDRIRMLREGQAMARVTHPNVITVYEVGTEGGSVFLAQELLDGGTLGEWLKKPRDRAAVIEKFIAAGRGLAAAHAADLVHRDFKPDNVLLGKDGRVRVADFGLARAATALGDALAMTQRGGGPRVDADPMASPMSALTRTGTVMGTPMFMAPEQHKGERADAKSDQFAFCVSLYHALYKAWPFDGKTAPALADAVIDGRLAPGPKTADVPARVRKILLRGLATEQGARYPSMAALLADLEPEIRPPAKSRLPLLLGALVLVLAAGAAAYVVMSRRETKKAVVVAPTPTVPTGIGAPTTDDGVGWITSAIDKGQLGGAIEKLDLAVGIASRDGKPAQTAIAQAAGVYMRVLRAAASDLKDVDARLEQATKLAAADPVARGYVDLAEASLALARGQLPAARERSASCAAALAAAAPPLAATCHQLHGDAEAALGDATAARTAYEAGLAIAEQAKTDELASTLQLALAHLELDDQHAERAEDIARKVLTQCDDRDAIGCSVYARILLSRVSLLSSDNDRQAAEELLSSVKPSRIEAFPVQIAHAIALGELHGYIGEAGDDGILGLDRIESARAQAEVRGLLGLVFSAKLARVRVLLIQGTDDAAEEVASLAKQARAAKFERIAHLAEASLAELADAPSAMLPADGGLPAVRTGSSGSP